MATQTGNTARGVQRRTEIIDAAIAVMAQVGLAGLSIPLIPPRTGSETKA